MVAVKQLKMLAVKKSIIREIINRGLIMLNEFIKIVGIVALFVVSCGLITKIGYNFGLTSKVHTKKKGNK